ncbi:hypothetical protein BS78_03G285900 [Paspalum vaginatum]|nr:hypothetical protein BS78_03G285900 [Paspalum vaginatum]
MKAAPYPYWLCSLLLAGSILVVASSAVALSPEETTAREKEAWTTAREAPAQSDEAFLARHCDRPPRVLPWCEQRLHARRHGAQAQHHRLLPMPPPSRDDEEVDPRYGVSKRLVPSGPNMLHH